MHLTHAVVNVQQSMEANIVEIQRLQDELKAAKEYSQVCEDESVELRRQLFDMSKEMKRLNKELERLSAARPANQKSAVPATPISGQAAAPSSRKRSARKTSRIGAETSDVTATASDSSGSESGPSSGGDHNMDDARLRRSARLRPSSSSMPDDSSAATVPKRKASARAAAASVESDDRPAPGSKKKRVTVSKTASAGKKDVEVELQAEQPTVVARDERQLGGSRPVLNGAGGMGEHPDPVSEDELPPAPPATAQDQMELLDVLAEGNLQLQAGWLPRMRALQQLKVLLTGTPLCVFFGTCRLEHVWG